PGVLTNATADIAFALLMAVSRRLPEGYDYVRADKWKTWGPLLLLGKDFDGATLGVIGFGRIGQQLAKRSLGFGMRVLYHDRARVAPEQEAVTGATFVSLDQLLAESDFVSVHVDLNASTRGLMNAEAFAKMKPGAVLVNTSRGPVVDQVALYDALAKGTLFGAGLDVTDPEPLRADHPLLSLPNCLIVPHIASATVATRDAMARKAANNLLAGLAGQPLPDAVPIPKS
ncbi:MAG: D-glycerate dehydrogenase, partial [Nocardioidaceae bacterium]